MGSRNRYGALKRVVFDILEGGQSGHRAGRIADGFLVVLIVLNVTAIVLESVKSLHDAWGPVFRGFEIFSVIVFTLEYVLRVWTADLKYPALKSGLKARLKYMLTPMALIDLLAVLPFYLPFVVRLDLRFLRILRLTRLLRLLKIQRYSKSLKLITQVVREKKEELIVTMFVTFILLVFASTLMFYMESEVQPDKFPNIIGTFWWAIATLTTIGYGDIYPVTGWGRVLSGLIAILGIGLVALPTGILGSGFIEKLNKERNKNQTGNGKSVKCPHCGKKYRI